MSVTLDADRFGRRLKSLYDCWQEGGAGWGGATAVAVVAGTVSEDIRYWKSASLHLWLLGYEFTETVMVFTRAELHVMAGSKKTEILRQLEAACAAAGVALRLHTKPKKEAGAEQTAALLAALRASGDAPVVGALPKEKPTGAVAEGWLKALADAGLATADVAAGLGDAMAVKDDDEIKNIKKAAYLLTSAINQRGVKELEDSVDEERKVKHSKLAEKIEDAISNPAKINVKLKADLVDLAYPASLQSGGEYEFRVGAASNDAVMHPGVVTMAAGARYASYCANVARTFFVDPNKQQEEEYGALLAAQAAAIAALVVGAPMSAAHEAAVKALQDKGQAALAGKLPKSVGAAIGLELRDSTQSLSASSAKPVKAGMAFNVALSVTGLTREDAEDSKGKTYALYIADTVIVKAEGAPEVVTAATAKDWSGVAYFVTDGSDASEEEEADGDAAGGDEAAPQVGIRKSARTEQVDFKLRDEERRRQKENQEELLERVNEATLQMLTKGGGASGSGTGAGRKVTDLVAYRSPGDMQHNNALTVQVDHRNECVLVPVYGHLVPFHILTIKNATSTQEGEHTYIRINFNVGPTYEPGVKFPQAIFLKEISFRSQDHLRATKVVQEIKSMRSAVQQREKEKAERATLVQQERLTRSKGRVYSLPEVWVRPVLGGKGRKMAGTLEAHANGFRYTTPKGEELDIMYRNIKHAFFQPAEKEMISLVHFHLINPIMVGKKKSNDVQFYTEVMESHQTLDAGRRSMYDPDEIEEEQRERERRNTINRTFQQFVKRVQQDVWERDFGDLNLEFEIPFRELGFTGVPHRSTGFVMPTVNCLVELIEMPFTVITLSEVNLVNMERVGFNLRNFDMVFIWKDLDRDVGRIDTIPSHHLETIKDWLTSIDIKYYESKVNLNWKNIVKSIKEDPEGFIEGGGWNFLDAEQSESEEESEPESDFAPSGDEAGSDDDDESSEDESVVESEDDSEYGGEDSEDEGMDWDELEEEARAEDKQREFSDEEEPRKRKGGGDGGGGKKARR